MRFPVLALSALALLGTPALAQQPSGQGQSITVTGDRLQAYRDRLAACLARNCPVNEDVDATAALAEALFLQGDYREARSYVRASLSRNRDRAREFPEPVSDLYRIQARLARNIGFDREARTSSFDILNALQAGLPQEDYRHFTARYEIAENQMMSGNFEGARRELRRLIGVARAAGREDVATLAELRDMQYELIAVPGSDARSELLRWSRLTQPAQRLRAIGARLVLASDYRAQGQAAQADALLAEIGRDNRGGAQRRLLHSPQFALMQQGAKMPDLTRIDEAVQMGRTLNRLSDNFENAWVDIGFWILPDGHVSGAEILRRGANASWATGFVNAIRRRVYAAGPEPTYRIERYVYTAEYVQTSGSRMPVRSPFGRVEYFDLTNGVAPPTPPTPRPDQNGGRPVA
jgi:tetratricopeptide (TPR) repeat protein